MHYQRGLEAIMQLETHRLVIVLAPPAVCVLDLSQSGELYPVFLQESVEQEEEKNDHEILHVTDDPHHILLV